MRDPAEPIRTMFIVGIYIGFATVSTFLALAYAVAFIDGNAFLATAGTGPMTVVGAIILVPVRLAYLRLVGERTDLKDTFFTVIGCILLHPFLLLWLIP